MVNLWPDVAATQQSSCTLASALQPYLDDVDLENGSALAAYGWQNHRTQPEQLWRHGAADHTKSPTQLTEAAVTG